MAAPQMSAPVLSLSPDVLNQVLSHLDGRLVLKLAFLLGNRALSTILLNTATDLRFELLARTRKEPILSGLIQNFRQLRLLHINDRNWIPYHSYEFVSNLPSSIQDLNLNFKGAHEIWVLPATKLLAIEQPRWIPAAQGECAVVMIKDQLPSLTKLSLSGRAARPTHSAAYSERFESNLLSSSIRHQFLRGLPQTLIFCQLSPLFYGELDQIKAPQLQELVIAPERGPPWYAIDSWTLILHIKAQRVSQASSISLLSNLPQLTHLTVAHACNFEELTPHLPPTLETLHFSPPHNSRRQIQGYDPTQFRLPSRLTSLNIIDAAIPCELIPLLPRTLTHLGVSPLFARDDSLYAPPGCTWSGDVLEGAVWPPKLTSLLTTPSAHLPAPSSLSYLKLKFSYAPKQVLTSIISASPELISLEARAIVIDDVLMDAINPLPLTRLRCATIDRTVANPSHLPSTITSLKMTYLTEDVAAEIIDHLVRLRKFEMGTMNVDGSSIPQDATELSEEVIESAIRKRFGRFIPEEHEIVIPREERQISLRKASRCLQLNWSSPSQFSKLKIPFSNILSYCLPLDGQSWVLAEDLRPFTNLLRLETPRLAGFIPRSLTTLKITTGLGSLQSKPAEFARMGLTTLEIPDWTWPLFGQSQTDTLRLPARLTHLNIGYAPSNIICNLPLTRLTMSQCTSWTDTAQWPRSIKYLTVNHPSAPLQEFSVTTFRDLPPKLRSLSITFIPHFAWSVLPKKRLKRLVCRSASPEKTDLKRLLKGRLSLDLNHVEELQDFLRSYLPHPSAQVETKALILEDIDLVYLPSKLRHAVLSCSSLSHGCIESLPARIKDLTFGNTALAGETLARHHLESLPPTLTRLTFLSSARVRLSRVNVLPSSLTYVNVCLSYHGMPKKDFQWPSALRVLVLHAYGFSYEVLRGLPTGLKRLEMHTTYSALLARGEPPLDSSWVSRLPEALEGLIAPRIFEGAPQVEEVVMPILKTRLKYFVWQDRFCLQ